MFFKFKSAIIFILFCLTISGVGYADDFEDGISIDDGIAIDDSLTPDVNFSFIKRYAIQKAKTVAGTTITADGTDDFLSDGDLFVNSILIDPGSVINGDITIIVNTTDTTVVNSN